MEREFKEWPVKSIKTNSKQYFKYVQSRKLARGAVGPLNDQGLLRKSGKSQKAK